MNLVIKVIKLKMKNKKMEKYTKNKKKKTIMKIYKIILDGFSFWEEVIFLQIEDSLVYSLW